MAKSTDCESDAMSYRVVLIVNASTIKYNENRYISSCFQHKSDLCMFSILIPAVFSSFHQVHFMSVVNNI